MALISNTMVLYLTGGWYTQIGQRRLRDEVVDGAIDTASSLFRAGVPPHAISNLALKIRALAAYADPPHRRLRSSVAQTPRFTDAERQVMRQRLQSDTDHLPALQGFVADCLEHVHDAMELRGLYLHLVHITRMMQLLQVARISGAAAGFLGGAKDPSYSPMAEPMGEWTPPPLAGEAPTEIQAAPAAASPPAQAARQPAALAEPAIRGAPRRAKPARPKPRR